MPIEFAIDRERDFTLFTGSGVLTVEDLLAVFDAYSAAGPTRLELYDFLQVTQTRLTGEDIRRISMIGVTKSSERIPGSKTVLVAASPDVYGLSRMYQLLGEVEGVVWDVEVHRTLQDGYAALGMAAPD
ncbi:MAG TPA: hypothetical protein PLD73_14100 [Candidatus Hydrogenedentes bacterium]|jgi:hypothetical protein|nr:hypothetical protein [Candidatus Hydrogenedentota bacterium]HPJ97927.1 hypothetical protein [Candidatus Hydrogenedentota bacterium]